MTKIITVHGTFAGEESNDGGKWWQYGSRFHKQLKHLYEEKQLAFEIEPFHWHDGPNSELQRRKFARKLLSELREIEKENDDCILISHSHGGSLVHHALLYSIYEGKPLNNIKKWITVGTPFLLSKRKRFLYSRLGFTGRSLFLYALIALFLGFMLSGWAEKLRRLHENSETSQISGLLPVF